jgi:hypothetical protein
VISFRKAVEGLIKSVIKFPNVGMLDLLGGSKDRLAIGTDGPSSRGVGPIEGSCRPEEVQGVEMSPQGPPPE